MTRNMKKMNIMMILNQSNNNNNPNSSFSDPKQNSTNQLTKIIINLLIAVMHYQRRIKIFSGELLMKEDSIAQEIKITISMPLAIKHTNKEKKITEKKEIYRSKYMYKKTISK